MIRRALAALLLLAPLAASVQAQSSAALSTELERRVGEVTSRVVGWRRDIHANPELGNREFRTAKLVAEHLRSLGIEVKENVAHTGVVGILRGGRPGKVVALRADMDGLPVTEQVDLPFASKVTTQYEGNTVGVMHACGHDNHVAILMGVAEVLAGMKDKLPGTVKFIFQPAEEGAPAGEKGGASMMIEEGVLEAPAPTAIFGLHVHPDTVGRISFRAGGTMASSDRWRMVVRGMQTHGARPWNGVDPIVVSAQIITGLQTIVSRQMDIAFAPSVVTVGMINGGVRNNIIPDSVVMVGTIRTLDPQQREDIHAKVRRTAEGIAASAGATVALTISRGADVTFNDPALTERFAPTLNKVSRNSKAGVLVVRTGAEDFSAYQQRIPGLFFHLGVTPDGQDPAKVPTNHSPLFFADEKALPVGVRALAQLAVDYLSGK